MKIGATRINSAILILTLLSSSAGAEENWFCTDGTSRRVGNELHVCGVAQSADEGSARIAALQNAKSEFDKLCDASSDCKGRAVTLDPARSDCEKQSAGFQCRRLIVFRIGEAATDASGGSRGSNRTGAEESVPKIDKGMRKSEVLALFGEPAQVDQINDQWITFQYMSSDFCAAQPCTVTLYNDRVDHYYAFKTQNTRALEDKSFWASLKFW